MPGKVNPVIPELVIQVCHQVIGNAAASTAAGAHGQFELNVRVPLIARNLFDQIKLLAAACRLLDEKCVAGLEANRERLNEYKESNLQVTTALNEVIGYDKGAEIVKEAASSGRTIREVAIERASTRRSTTTRSTTRRSRSRTAEMRGGASQPPCSAAALATGAMAQGGEPGLRKLAGRLGRRASPGRQKRCPSAFRDWLPRAHRKPPGSGRLASARPTLLRIGLKTRRVLTARSRTRSSCRSSS